MTNLDDDNHRYLSLTGVAMEVSHARDHLTPACDWIKAKVFDHGPDDPIIFHRYDICGKRKRFGILRDAEKLALFDKAIMRVFSGTEYRVITALWTNGHWPPRRNGETSTPITF